MRSSNDIGARRHTDSMHVSRPQVPTRADAMNAGGNSREAECQRTRISPFERFRQKSRPLRTPGTCSYKRATLRPKAEQEGSGD
jgi:hypothetical protein